MFGQHSLRGRGCLRFSLTLLLAMGLAAPSLAWDLAVASTAQITLLARSGEGDLAELASPLVPSATRFHLLQLASDTATVTPAFTLTPVPTASATATPTLILQPTGSPGPTTTPAPTTTPMLSLAPSPVYITQNLTATLAVRIENTSGFREIWVGLRFTDRDKVEIIRVERGPCPGTHPTTSIIDREQGEIGYVVTVPESGPPATCNGTVLSVVVRGRAAGITSLYFTNHLIRDAEGNYVEPGTISADINVVLPLGTLIGRVSLQGRLLSRNNFGGTQIQAGQAYTTTTTSNGSFSLTLPPGTYVVTMTHTSYLPSILPGILITDNVTTSLHCIELVGGDVNGNGEVDIFDLVKIGKHYGQAAAAYPPADVNDDGNITLGDLVLIGVNYGLSGSQIRPCPGGQASIK